MIIVMDRILQEIELDDEVVFQDAYHWHTIISVPIDEFIPIVRVAIPNVDTSLIPIPRVPPIRSRL